MSRKAEAVRTRQDTSSAEEAGANTDAPKPQAPAKPRYMRTVPINWRELARHARPHVSVGPDGRSGSPPEDRKFRPDVEGLRAVAILLVVLYHAGVPHAAGGYVGVDVFLLISGFVITGLLLREHDRRGRISLVEFYARRARRILPAATLVIIVVIGASYHWLGFIRAGEIASDARASSLFYSNFHFIATKTDYINSQLAPSPLQTYWSLGVEEQFYLVYPALFLLLALVGLRLSFRIRLAFVLAAVAAISLAWSGYQTNTNGIVAYFSPFTRAWELALGGLIAVTAVQCKRMSRSVAAALTWAGAAAIVWAAVTFSDTTKYPGLDAAVPVFGAGLIVAAGTAMPRFGTELVLRLRAFQWLGKLSFSWYLWHWPLLTIYQQRTGQHLSVGTKLALVAIALLLSAMTYVLIENPIRHIRLLVRHPGLSVATGLLLAGLGAAISTYEIDVHA